MIRPALAAALVTLLAGCVTAPKLGPAPPLRAAGEFAAERTLVASERAWPQAQWWKAYGDAQLNTLIEEGLANAPSMAIAAARLQRAQAQADLAGAQRLPVVSADGVASIQRPSEADGIPVLPQRQGYHDYGRAVLSFAWELDFWGKQRAALSAATSDARAAEAEAAAARLLLSTAIASTYADLIRLSEDRRLLDEAVELRRHNLRLVRSRTERGYDSQADLALAEAGPPAAEADLAAADEAVALLRNRLAALVGAGPDRGLSIEVTKAIAPASFGLPSTLGADLVGRRPDIVAARWRVEAASGRIDVAHANFYPNINLLGFLGASALGLENLFSTGSETGNVGAAISLPIFDAGRRRATYRGARADYDAAVAVYNDTVIQALRDVADVVQSERQLAPQQRGVQEALAATEWAYRLAEQRYTAGAADYLSVLVAQDRLIARRRASNALAARAFSLDVALIRALGGAALAPAQALPPDPENTP